VAQSKSKSTKPKAVTIAAVATSDKPGKHDYLGIKVVIGLIGLTLSIILHELFHVLMHLDQIPHIGLFPGHSGAIVEILVQLPQGYDLEGEEIVAYTITLLVMLATVMIIFKIHDHTDERTSAEILFPYDKEMQKMSPEELLKLVDRADIAEVHKTLKNDKSVPPEKPTVAPAKKKKPRQ
jgi:hypothetical protein